MDLSKELRGLLEQDLDHETEHRDHQGLNESDIREAMGSLAIPANIRDIMQQPEYLDYQEDTFNRAICEHFLPKLVHTGSDNLLLVESWLKSVSTTEGRREFAHKLLFGSEITISEMDYPSNLPTH